jgi:hypothetical protein
MRVVASSADTCSAARTEATWWESTGAQGREVGIGRYRRIEEQSRVQRCRQVTARVTVRQQVDVAEQREQFVDSEAGGVLQLAERRELNQRILVEDRGPHSRCGQQQIEFPHRPVRVPPYTQEPVYPIEVPYIQWGRGQALQAQVAGVVDALQRQRRPADTDPHDVEQFEQMLVGDVGGLQERGDAHEVDAWVGRAPRDRGRHVVGRADEVGLVGVDREAGGGDAGPLRQRRGVQRQKLAAQLPQLDARLPEVGTEFVQGLVVGQRVWVVRGGECGVGVRVHVFRRSAELWCRQRGLSPGRHCPWCDGVLE